MHGLTIPSTHFILPLTHAEAIAAGASKASGSVSLRLLARMSGPGTVAVGLGTADVRSGVQDVMAVDMMALLEGYSTEGTADAVTMLAADVVVVSFDKLAHPAWALRMC